MSSFWPDLPQRRRRGRDIRFGYAHRGKGSSAAKVKRTAAGHEKFARALATRLINVVHDGGVVSIHGACTRFDRIANDNGVPLEIAKKVRKEFFG
jgi:hypothetical protein